MTIATVSNAQLNNIADIFTRTFVTPPSGTPLNTGAWARIGNTFSLSAGFKAASLWLTPVKNNTPLDATNTEGSFFNIDNIELVADDFPAGQTATANNCAPIAARDYCMLSGVRVRYTWTTANGSPLLTYTVTKQHTTGLNIVNGVIGAPIPDLVTTATGTLTLTRVIEDYDGLNPTDLNISGRTTTFLTVTPAPTAVIGTNFSTLTCAQTTATLTASGGGAYAWSGGGTNSTKIVTAGTYTVTVTAANGCTATATRVITANTTAPTVTIASATGVCLNTTTVLTASGGSTYAWNGGGTGNTKSVTAGTYTVTATGANGCTATATRTVALNTATATATATGNPYTSGQTIQLSSTGGGSYAWSGPNGFTASAQTPTLSNASTAMAGTYVVTVTNTNGCTATAAVTIQVSLPSPCTLLTGETVIIKNTVWNTNSTQSKNIRIKSGVTLRIENATISMANNLNIIVEAGGALALVNATLTNDASCGGHWYGIWLGGVSAGQSQVAQNSNVQARLDMIINSKIEHAFEAVTTWDYDTWQPTGGIVRVSGGSKFLNNMRAVSFYQFHRKDEINNTNMEAANDARFRVVTFARNTDFRADADWTPMPHVTAWDVHGVGFSTCTFLEDPTSNRYPNATGIYSEEATFNVGSSTFQGLFYGIRALNDGRSNLPLSVVSSTFGTATPTDNLQTEHGIYLSAMRNFAIGGIDPNLTNLGNTFYSGNFTGTDPDLPPYGLYLDGCPSGYQVALNKFTNNRPTQGLCFGVLVNNGGGEANQIYKNTFTKQLVGVHAIGVNRNAAGTGLQIRCNEFIDGGYDINATQGDATVTSLAGVARNQGVPFTSPLNVISSQLAGNIFSGLSLNAQHWYNEGTYLDYWHHFQDPSLMPIVRPQPNHYTANTITLHPANNIKDAASCPDPTFLTGSTTGSMTAMAGAWQQRADAAYQRGMYKNLLMSLKDGGNTALVKNEVAMAQLQDAYTLYTDLMQKSPYLSEDVLVELAEKQNFPNAMLKDILLANQHAAKCAEVLEKIDERVTPMPEYMMEQVEQSAGSMSAKDFLEARIAEQEGRYSQAISTQLNLLHADTTATHTDYAAVLSATQTYATRLEYLDFLLQQGEVSTATQVLTDLNTATAITEKEADVQQGYAELYALKLALAASGRTYENLTRAEKDGLIAISGNANYAASTARGILRHLNGGDTYKEPIPAPPTGNTQRKVVRSKNNAVVTAKILNLFPNPAKDYLTITYALPESATKRTLEVIDPNGRLVYTQIIADNHNSLILSVTDYPATWYLCRISEGNTRIAEYKFDVIK